MTRRSSSPPRSSSATADCLRDAAAARRAPRRLLGISRRQVRRRRIARRVSRARAARRARTSRRAVGDEILTTTHAYPERRVELHFFRCELPDEPRPQLGQEMRWVRRDELADAGVSARRRGADSDPRTAGLVTACSADRSPRGLKSRTTSARTAARRPRRRAVDRHVRARLRRNRGARRRARSAAAARATHALLVTWPTSRSSVCTIAPRVGGDVAVERQADELARDAAVAAMQHADDRLPGRRSSPS